MVKSGLESMVDQGSSSMKCPDCRMPLIQKIETQYNKHYLCNNGECDTLLFPVSEAV